MSVAAHPTGAELVHSLWEAARVRGVTLGELAAPLSYNPQRYLRQLRWAARPKPATVARVEALIAGRELPPPANSPQSSVTTATCGRGPAAREELDYRRALAEAAGVDRRPGETLDAAQRRLERELAADASLEPVAI